MLKKIKQIYMNQTQSTFCGAKSLLYLTLMKPFLFVKKKSQKKMFQESEVNEVKRILVSNWANMGDVVLSTSVLPAIKKAFPECIIGFLVAPHTKVIVDTHPLVDHVHVIPNWFLQWKTESFLKTVSKFFFYSFFRYSSVVKEIREKNYDCAIELYPFFPNTEDIFWKAKILYRVGFASSLQSQLLSHAVPFPKNDQYLPNTYKHLLEKIGVDSIELSPSLLSTIPSYLKSQPKNKYLIFHLGTTDRSKEWKTEKWRNLAKLFEDEGYELYFTGKGNAEEKIIEEVIFGYRHCKSVCNKLKWEEFVELIKNTSLLISVDSVPVHIASAFNVPFITLYFNTPSLPIWRPAARNSLSFVEKVDSSQNREESQCENILFFKEINERFIYEKAIELLKEVSVNTL